MSGPMPVAVPSASLAGGDPTRRFGVQSDDDVLFPGLTRPEADAACEWLARTGPAERRRLLVPVELGVVLSDGAGPHLVDASGALVLVLGPHPSIAGASLAMGAPSPLHAVGIVEPRDECWRWIARADVPEAGRVDALDALDSCADEAAARRWEARGPSGGRTLAP